MDHYNRQQPILALHDICKSYPGVQALDSVSFDLQPGEIHALAGENGAGKSTLVKIIMGVVKKDSGTILMNDRVIQLDCPKSAWENGISAVYQELSLVPHLTVAANLFLGREIKNKIGIVNDKLMNQKADQILREFEIPVKADTLVKDLNFGYKQLVEIVKALSFKAQVIVMDEPTSSLTTKEERKLFHTLCLLREKGVSIIYISHKMNEIFEIADRITVIRDGKNVSTFISSQTDTGAVIGALTGEKVRSTDLNQRGIIGRDEPILQVKNFSAVNLKNISFELYRGEILGIGGLLDSGKSELARALFGALQAEGELYLENRPVVIDSPRTAIKHGIMLVPEERQIEGVILDHSIERNITLPIIDRLLQKGIVINQKACRNTAAAQVDQLRVATPNIHKSVKQLSGGNQQKVVIAKGLVINPKVLIMAKPTQGVDVGARSEVHQIVRNVASRGVAVLLVSSDPSELLALSDRILIIHKGRLAAEFSSAEIPDKQFLIEAIQENYA